ncbi:MAG: glycosyltransferase [Anaerolineae bacterium]|nr:glycosyltransferase [Anaerolineae bacterium]
MTKVPLQNKSIKVIHIITGLGIGGAEMMLYKLLSAMDKEQFEQCVISLTGHGAVGKKIQQLGISVWALGMRPSLPDARLVATLVKKLRQEQADIIQTWMYHADLLGGIAARLAGNKRVIWGMRNTDLSPLRVKRRTIWTARLCALLSHWLPQRIVINSQVSRQTHIRLGYRADKMVVIPNGFDLQVFKPDQEARISVRQELGIEDQTPLIGMIARFDSQKDHLNFVQAAALLSARMPQTRYLLCGEGITWQNQMLAGWIDTTGLRNVFHLLGEREDIPRLMAALDIATLSSVGEAFPNVVGEAMACAIPCVVTDAGDSAYIVGDTGRVVARRNPHALAQAWNQVLEMPIAAREQMGKAARARIEQEFSLARICTQYEELYRQIVYTV